MTLESFNQSHISVCATLFVGVFNSAPWNEEWSVEGVEQRFQECLATPGYRGLVGHEEGEVVAFALGNVEGWDKIRHFYLKEICVATRCQRMGVGQALMNELEARLKGEGIEKIYLLTARETPAESFYEKQGYYVSPKMIMMAKWLNPR